MIHQYDSSVRPASHRPTDPHIKFTQTPNRLGAIKNDIELGSHI